MKACPIFPPYCQASPPRVKRWLVAGAGGVLLVSNIVALVRPDVEAPLAWYAMIPGLAALWLLCLLFRWLFYRFARHNAWIYQQQVEWVQQCWWHKHRQQIALAESVLVGARGTTPEQWLRVTNQSHGHGCPEPIKETQGQAVRFLRSGAVDIEQREIQLAKVAVNQWQKQRQDQPPLCCTPIHCYWLGSATVWQEFVAQMAVQFPDVVLPAQPQYWRGIDTLDEMIDLLNATTGSKTTILCAGCQCMVSEAESALPAGEAAFIWLLKKTGNVVLTRGEYFQAQDNEQVIDVAARALVQADISQPPETCFLFSQPDEPALEKTGWNITQHVQDLNWGNIGGMEAVVVQTLAAISAENTGQPCGWLARDPQHTLTFGIVKSYGTARE
ncbi:hypothetical protein Ppb6_00640 [Photorhabdus australis subsp. thailandensis]|uniref:Uncharacterized protein n=1 Tax=Photorhabdus australis subsp. thailandensis TaxID=2805096 RepID=A0A1C0U873_9GAMM|nr:hypothetical protein [Photorhabdus australis]OCQ54138.1 hypothetical protein Ppb6_00640 [Photorhabdus australis subsp. thailandensis]